jgi:antitoxin VapB
MAFHIRDPKTDALVRQLATQRGIGLTDAVRAAVENELARERQKIPVMERLKPLFNEIDALPKTGLEADKAFYDWLSGEEDD